MNDDYSVTVLLPSEALDLLSIWDPATKTHAKTGYRWRLPSGEKETSDKSIAETVKRVLIERTGIHIECSQVEIIRVTRMDIKRKGKRHKAFTYSYNNYVCLVRILEDQFIERKDFPAHTDTEIRFLDPEKILMMPDFVPSHKNEVEHYFLKYFSGRYSA